MILTATHLIEMIQELPRNHPFGYVNPKSQSVVEILHINAEDCYVTLKRTTKDNICKESRVNSTKLKTIADGLLENTPISIDDLLRNNDNVRSAIEAILVRTSEIYTYVVKNHKTLVWVPSKPHKTGAIFSLDPSDFHLVKERSLNIIDSKLITAISNLMERELNETKAIIPILHDIKKRLSGTSPTEDVEKINRGLNEVSSKLDSLLEREQRIFTLLTQ